MSVIDQMETLASTLRLAGHAVVTPARDALDGRWTELSLDAQVAAKRRLIGEHLDEIRRSDVVLIANVSVDGVEGRIGANTPIEAAFAKAMGIPIVLLEPPGPQPRQLEILALQSGSGRSETTSASFVATKNAPAASALLGGGASSCRFGGRRPVASA